MMENEMVADRWTAACGHRTTEPGEVICAACAQANLDARDRREDARRAVTHRCAGEGCARRVREKGTYCRQCAFDED